MIGQVVSYPAERAHRLKSPVGRLLTDPLRPWYITSQSNSISGVDQVVSLALSPSNTKSAAWRLPKDPDRLAEFKGNEMCILVFAYWLMTWRGGGGGVFNSSGN